jgi:hypothetical protein
VGESPMKSQGTNFGGLKIGYNIKVRNSTCYGAPEHGPVTDFFAQNNFAYSRSECDLRD